MTIRRILLLVALVLVVLLAWRISGVFMYHTWVRWVWRVLISPYVIVGIIFAITTVLLIVVCLGRIRYNVDAGISNDKFARVEVSYLLRLVHFVLVYENGKLSNRVRIAWIRLGEKKPHRRKRKKNGTKPPEITPAAKASETAASEPVTKASETAANEPVAKPDSEKTAAKLDAISATVSDEPNEPDDEKEEKGRTNTLNQIKQILTYPDRKIIMSLCIRSLQKFMNALKPRHLEISGVIGFEDPCTTGWAMGAYEAIVGVLGLRHKIRIWGSYVEKELMLNIQVDGRTRVLGLLWPFIWLYLHKPIRILLHNHIF